MKYTQIRDMDISNGEGIGIALFTQGCPYHCKNCFNPETWDFESGKDWNQETENLIIELMKPDYIKRLTILGGEPLIERNIEPLTKLLTKVKENYPEKKVWLYTGGNFESEIEKNINLIKNIDIIIDGKFIDSLKNPKLKFRGSSNQRVIDVKKSIENNKTILYLE